jgi:MscS family membrane protein
MTNTRIRDLVSGRVRLLAMATLLAVLVPAGVTLAQTGARGAAPPAPPPAAPQAQAPTDPLGRDTPRGMLLGFMRTSRAGNLEAASLYLNSGLTGEAAFELSRKLYMVLDRRLPARTNEISNVPEGSQPNPLKPDEDILGTISTETGQLELVVERVRRGSAASVWLFSRRTLDAIPDVYAEIDLFTDRLPGFMSPRPRIRGARGHLVVVLLIVPAWHRLT